MDFSNNYSRRNHYVNGEMTVDKSNFNYYDFEKPIPKRHWLTLLYFPIVMFWMEFMVKLSANSVTLSGMFFTLLFTLPIAGVLTFICTLTKSRKANRIFASIFTSVLAIWYGTQIVYQNVFGTYLVVNSITNGGAKQALNSTDMILTAILSRIIFIILIFLPLALNIIFAKRLFMFQQQPILLKIGVIVFAVAIQISAILLVNCDKDSTDTKSNYNLYYGDLQQNSVCERFGILTMQRIDITRLIFGYGSNVKLVKDEVATPDTATFDMAQKIEVKPQVIETDFKELYENTTNEDLKTLYEYFDTASPSYTNEYTGMFGGYNVIFITAESFSRYAIDEKYTPTLYKMYREGFQFENFYSPAWGVSTTDGEYANLLGIIPKSGVWSFARSAENNIAFPFSLAQQARAKDFEQVRAYHNHTYDYYDRDKYLTNLGYDYKAIGKGLDLGEDVWPNSDLKMMQNSVSDYINSDSFSVYYMTVSGHGGYSYNNMSVRNSDLVADLNYSDEVKGYIAANIELDKAMEYLLGELEKAGKLDNTLICITDDHYPYSLDEFNGLDELAGHKIDTTFERYENAWILWSGSMEESVKVTTPCSSLDILPTMLNMLGYEYDSRTIIGTDVFGQKSPFVVFADRSWISQNGKYNANTGEYTAFENAKGEDDIDKLNSKCTNMFTVSRMILDENAYAHIYGDNHYVGE